MKRVVYSLLISFQFFLSGAQQKEPFLAFDSESHDFGRIKEDGGQVTHKFIFTNTGSMPLVIKEVKPSCGCTTPNWTKEPVLPGNKGFVAATFDPSGRPGVFSKTVTVVSNASNNPVVLKFNGTVSPKPKKPEDLFPVILDSIRLTGSFFYFDTIYFGESRTKKVEMWNVKKIPATITFENIPKYIKVIAKPATLKPDEKGIIELTYNAKEKNDWGYVSDYIQFVVNNKPNPNNRITISADIKEDFSKWSPKQIENAPKIVVLENNHEFGTVKRGDMVKYDFEIRNDGKSDLIIRKKSASCGCTVADLPKTSLNPGESLKIPVTLNTSTKSGDVAITVTLITNDPKNSKVILFLRGKVLDTATENK